MLMPSARILLLEFGEEKHKTLKPERINKPAINPPIVPEPTTAIVGESLVLLS